MIEKITHERASELCIASLPTRPTAPKSSGGAGFSSKEMKAAFDALPLYVIEKYNGLIDAIRSVGDGSLAAEIPTGIHDGHTLDDIFKEVVDGSFASYLTVGEHSLATEIAEIHTLLDQIKERIRL